MVYQTTPVAACRCHLGNLTKDPMPFVSTSTTSLLYIRSSFLSRCGKHALIDPWRSQRKFRYDTPLATIKDRSELLQRTLDLMIFKTLDALGPLHGTA